MNAREKVLIKAIQEIMIAAMSRDATKQEIARLAHEALEKARRI